MTAFVNVFFDERNDGCGCECSYRGLCLGQAELETSAA